LEFSSKIENKFIIPYTMETPLPGTTVKLNLDSNSKVHDVIKRAQDHLLLASQTGLGLGVTITYENSTRLLDEDEFIFDAFTQIEIENSIDTQGGIAMPKLTLKKVLLPVDEEVKEKLLVDILIQQITTLYQSPTFTCPKEDAAFVGSIFHLLKNPNTSADDSLQSLIPSLVPPKMLVVQDKAAWETQIKECIRLMGKTTPDALKKKLIHLTKYWPGVYGKQFQAVCVGKSKEKVFGKSKADENRDVIIHVDSTGIGFINPQNQTDILQLPYIEIEKFDSSKDSFDLQLDGVIYNFKTAKAQDLKEYATSMVNKLTKVSKLVLGLIDNNSDSKDALRFSKDDLIELLDDTSEPGYWRGKSKGKVGWFSPDLVEPVVLKPKHLHEEEKKKRAALQALEQKKANENAQKKPEAPKADTSTQFSMLNYAKMYFVDSTATQKKEPTGLINKITLGRKRERNESLSWGWAQIVEKIKHSRIPITTPLTKIYDVEDQESSLESFKIIMRFMGDLPSKASVVDSTKQLIKMGLARSLIRDELYCQVIKQITGHPERNGPNCRKGWELLCLCASFFGCSTTFEPYLKKYIHTYANDPSTEFHDIAKKCEIRFKIIKKGGPRQFPPTNDEILAVQGKPLFVKVVFPDSSVKAIEIHSATTGKELNDNICKKFGLENPEEYTVTYTVGSKAAEKMIFNSTYVMDLIGELENLENVPKESVGTIRKSNSESFKIPEVKFFFKKFLWPKEPLNFANEQLINIVFAQNCDKIMKGEIKYTFDDALELAATRIRVLNIDAEKTPSQKEDSYQPFILSSHLKKLDIKDWVTQIDEVLVELRKLSVHEAKVRYVKRVLSWPTFGDSNFMLDKPKFEKTELPSQVMLAINAEGIKLIHPEKKEVIVSLPYQEISSWRFAPESISMKTGGMVQRAQKNLKAQTDQGQEICHIISLYVAAQSNENQNRLSVLPR